MPPLYHRVWQYLKYKTNHRMQSIPMRDGSHFDVKPGQHLTSIRNIAKGVGYMERHRFHEPNPRTIRSILNWLEQEHMISINRGLGNRQYTLITLTHWEKYQLEESKVTVDTPVGAPVDTPVDTPVGAHKQEVKEVKELNTTATTKRAHENSSGDSGGISTPDPLRGDRSRSSGVREIPQTPERGRDALDKLCERYNELRTMQVGTKQYPKPADYDAMTDLLQQVPPEDALRLLNQCFEDFNQRARHSPGAKISSFRYCSKYIVDHYRALQAKQQAKKTIRKRGVKPREKPAGYAYQYDQVDLPF
nr:MAG TPA: fatty acid metabolism regulator protein [Caudoviricetes sp.]